jgi:hypothetical protein
MNRIAIAVLLVASAARAEYLEIRQTIFGMD